jgi:hypothetical protein
VEKAELELDITWEDGACAITGFDSFDLHSSCHCGQAFRWRRSGPNSISIQPGSCARSIKLVPVCLTCVSKHIRYQ